VASVKTYLEGNYVLTQGVNFKARTISFGNIDESDNAAEGEWSNADFTFTNVEIVIRAIHEMVLQSPTKPITIRMSSAGGNLIDALHLKDVILSSPCQFKFVGGGIIASSATIIMAVCDERYLHKDSIIMLHELSAGVSGKHSEHKVELLVNDRLVDVMAEVYADNSFMSKPYYKALLGSGRDVHFWADEAVTLGLADKVIQHQKRGSLRKMRADAKKSGINTEKLQSTLQKIHDRAHYKHSEAVKVRVLTEEVDENLVIEEVKVDE
jgi:ATP-dependent protease ClpP protease subunit